MKNTQNSQTSNNDQTLNSDKNEKRSNSQSQSDTSNAHLDKAQSPGNGLKNKSTDAEHSNISVDNEGKIGRQEQWNNDNNNRNATQNNVEADNQPKNEKNTDAPEIDSPIYEPGKTERKMPRMEEQSKNKQ